MSGHDRGPMPAAPAVGRAPNPLDREVASGGVDGAEPHGQSPPATSASARLPDPAPQPRQVVVRWPARLFRSHGARRRPRCGRLDAGVVDTHPTSLAVALDRPDAASVYSRRKSAGVPNGRRPSTTRERSSSTNWSVSVDHARRTPDQAGRRPDGWPSRYRRPLPVDQARDLGEPRCLRDGSRGGLSPHGQHEQGSSPQVHLQVRGVSATRQFNTPVNPGQRGWCARLQGCPGRNLTQDLGPGRHSRKSRAAGCEHR
jgi:hypothetical protein